MAGRARLTLIAAVLMPLPLLAALSWGIEAGSARGLPKLVVSSRDGDLYVGKRLITPSAASDTEPDWSPDRRKIARSPANAARVSMSCGVTVVASSG